MRVHKHAHRSTNYARELPNVHVPRFQHPLISSQHQPTTKQLRAFPPRCAAYRQDQPVHRSRTAVFKLFAAPDANVTVQESLLGYICAGPLLKATGITHEQVQQEFSTWQKLGRLLSQQLGFHHDSMDAVQRLRVYHYYLPVFFWVQQQMQQHQEAFREKQATPPLVLGISAPQGCGKSTLVEQLEQLFSRLGVGVASVSIDDFYLTNAGQTALAAANPGNRLLALRGNAGSHDLQLGSQTLQQLRQLTHRQATAKVPRYDKSAFQGRGDRADPSCWPAAMGPLDLVLFEGWMLGFRPVGEAAAAVEDALLEVDRQLAAYEAAWDSLVDSWLVIKIADPQWVFGWRLQAEQRMRAAGKPGMTDEQIADFVSRYIPAYKAYLSGLYEAGPTTARAGHTLIIEVDKERCPVPQQPQPLRL